MSPAVSATAPAGATAPGVLAALALAMLLSSLGTSIANVALPTLVKVFDTAFGAVQWVVLAYLLAVTTLVVSIGRLGDLAGRRRLLMAGTTLFTLASAACAVAPQFWVLVAARVAQGCGAAAMMVLALALVGDAVPRERAGRAMGLLGTMSAVGTALGPSLGGVLIAGLGWRAIFLASVPLGLLALALMRRFLPADAPPRRRVAFDLPSSLLLALTLTAYALSMTWQHGPVDAPGVALLATALLGAGLFVLRQRRHAAPLVDLKLLRLRAVSAGFAMSALVTTVAMTTLVVGPFYLALALRLDAAAVGLVMTAGPLVAALAGVPAGRSVDRHGAQRVMIGGLVSMAGGCLALALLPLSSGVTGYVLGLVFTTAGFALFQAANNTAVVSGTPADQRGVVSGLLNLSRNLGLVTGASAMGAVFAAGAGAPDIGAAPAVAVAAGMHTAFAIAALLVAVALLLALRGAGPVPRVTALRPAKQLDP